MYYLIAESTSGLSSWKGGKLCFAFSGMLNFLALQNPLYHIATVSGCFISAMPILLAAIAAPYSIAANSIDSYVQGQGLVQHTGFGISMDHMFLVVC